MALSREEIQILVEKIRNKYRDYGTRFSPKWFDLSAFESRLKMTVDNRMNMEGFILAEIRNFEKLREKYEKKKKSSSFAEKVDKIIEENAARIRKYPPIEFHPRAGFEIVHFYGAMADYSQHIFPVLQLFLAGEMHKRKLQQFEEQLSFLAVPRGTKPSKRIEDHLFLLSRGDTREIELEKDKNEYLKDTAFVLHDISAFLDELMEKRNPEWEAPLRFDKLYIEGERKKKIISAFSGYTPYGAILKLKEETANIIADFRLEAFRRRAGRV